MPLVSVWRWLEAIFQHEFPLAVFFCVPESDVKRGSSAHNQGIDSREPIWTLHHGSEGYLEQKHTHSDLSLNPFSVQARTSPMERLYFSHNDRLPY